MKTLELNAYGVSEMNHQELLSTEGGSFLCSLGKVLQSIGSAVESFGKWLENVFC